MNKQTIIQQLKNGTYPHQKHFKPTTMKQAQQYSKARAARLFKGKKTAAIETVIVSTMDAMHATVSGCISACKQAEELKGAKLTKEEYQKAYITALLWPR